MYSLLGISSPKLIVFENVKSIRPSFGMHPKHLPELIGKKFKDDYEKGTPITIDMLY